MTLIGPGALEHDGRGVHRRGAVGGQAWLALAVLVLAGGRPVSRDELADALWPGVLPDSWESAVRNVVSRVRDLLEAVGLPGSELLVRSPSGYALLLPGDAVVDVLEARTQLDGAIRALADGRPAEAASLASQAGDRLAQPLLAGIDGLWLDAPRERLHDDLARARELTGEALLAAGDTGGAIAAARQAVAEAPFRESAHRLLMRGLAEAGNRAEALRAYEQCRRMLAEEIGVHPSPATDAVYRELLGTEPATAGPAPASAAPSPMPSVPGVPVVAEEGPLIGRDGELDRAVAMLDQERFVTLVGVGGVGKSRLAKAVANRSAVAPSDRRWWIELAPVSGPAVVHAVATAIGPGRLGADALSATVAELETGPALVVLDNCEHVREAVADLAHALLASCPQVRVLASSREAIGVAGEEVLILAPLPIPGLEAGLDEVAQNASVAIFAQRARASSRDFDLTPGNVAAVAEVCRRLDGLPLALELAGARVRSMPPEAIVEHLDERFRLLRRAPTDAGRHRNLEDAVRWSYETLSDDERVAFDRLSVLAGSFNLDAVAAVCELQALDALETVEALVARSMVAPVADEREERYAVLETLRDFGRAGLAARGGAEAVRRAHRAHFLDLAEQADLGMAGPDEARWVRRVDADFANVRAAWDGAFLDGDVDTCVRLVVALFGYGFFGIHREVAQWAADAVGLPGARQHPSFGDAAAVAAYLLWECGAAEEATRHLDVALEAGGGWILEDAIGTVALFRGGTDAALAAYERAAAVDVPGSNLQRRAIALSQQSFASMLNGRNDDAEALAAAAQRTAAASGNPTAGAQAAWAMGLALYDRDPAGALDELERAVALATSVGNRLAVGAATVPAEELRSKLAQRSPTADLAAVVDRLRYWLDAGAPPILWSTVRRAARSLAALGAHETAAVALGAEATATSKLPVRDRELHHHRAVVEHVRAALGDERYTELTERGAQLGADELLTEISAVLEGLAD